MFKSKAHRRYIVVNYHDASVRELEESTKGVSPRNQQVLEQWDRHLEKREEAMQLAEAVVVKTDHTLWFKSNKWPQHLAESNLRHLSRACRLPGRDEETLKDVPEKVEALIEECVKGLPRLGHVIIRWLRSAKSSEPDVLPLARLQNEDSQKRYAGYMTRFICYTLRVWKSCEKVGGAGSRCESFDEGGDEDEDGDEVEDGVEDDVEGATALNPASGLTRSSTGEVDTLKDARKL